VYGNRLCRAYLGASRPKRDPDPVTGFDPDDDLPLTDLRAGDGAAYDGPFLLVNAAMNLVRGTELAWHERKAESFVLTPLYCGGGRRRVSRRARRPAGAWARGRAAPSPAAAATPNLASPSPPAVTVLLPVFNARLGAWLGNPANDLSWRDPFPRSGFWYLFLE